MTTNKSNQKLPKKNRSRSIEYRSVMARFTPAEFEELESYSKREQRSFASTVQYFTLQKLEEVRQTA
ncbi:MAG: hypothetical protein NTW25_00560 [Candidatus Kapabacteria bacterium]|nr:hypothetical protein [Candidatus Kapabacteria bacterium]